MIRPICRQSISKKLPCKWLCCGVPSFCPQVVWKVKSSLFQQKVSYCISRLWFCLKKVPRKRAFCSVSLCCLLDSFVVLLLSVHVLCLGLNENWTSLKNFRSQKGILHPILGWFLAVKNSWLHSRVLAMLFFLSLDYTHTGLRDPELRWRNLGWRHVSSRVTSRPRPTVHRADIYDRRTGRDAAMMGGQLGGHQARTWALRTLMDISFLPGKENSQINLSNWQHPCWERSNLGAKVITCSVSAVHYFQSLRRL